MHAANGHQCSLTSIQEEIPENLSAIYGLAVTGSLKVELLTFVLFPINNAYLFLVHVTYCSSIVLNVPMVTEDERSNYSISKC